MRQFAALAVLVGLSSGPAAAFNAVNGLSVTPVGPQEFTVNFGATRNQTAYWCAAGDYVIRELGLSNKTRIYRTTTGPRKAGEGLTFTLDPAKAVPDSGISSFGTNAREDSISAGHASGSFCSIYDILPFP